MDGDLLLMSMFPVRINHPAIMVATVTVEVAGSIRPLRTLRSIDVVHPHRIRHRPGAVLPLRALRSIGTARLLGVLHRPEALR